MRIEKFRVQNYRSILDCGEVTLDPKITTLIGKNESGKTYTLKALDSFRDDYEYGLDDLCLGSEAKQRLQSGQITEADIEIVTIWFEVEKEDQSRLKDVHRSLAKMKTLKCSKRFDNSYHLESPDLSLGDLEIRAETQVNEKQQIALIQELATHLRENLDAHVERHPPLGAVRPQYNTILEDVNTWHPAADPEMESIIIRLQHLGNVDGPIIHDIETFIEQVRPHIEAIEEGLSSREDATDYIRSVLPQFVYFADVEKLEDSVPVADFLLNPQEHKTLSNLIRLSSLDLESVMEADHYQKLSAFRRASTTLTGLVNESWTQESVEVRVNVVDQRIVVSIYDDVMREDHPPSIRSQGFRWFLSFYTNFMAGSRGEFKNTVILLDDPGVFLHPSGQKDLLNTLERISDSNQVIFSTHSPFMVDREKLGRIRIVSKEEDTGSLLQDKFYVSQFDALQPIRASIGMTIGDTLFTGKKTLLVEGYSDELVLEAMVRCCSEAKQQYLDPSEVSILPVNGAGKMPYFATLLAKQNLDFLVLLDHDHAGKRAKKQLTQRFMVDEGRILMLDILAEEGEDLIIEDLIDFEFYLQAVNLAYRDILQAKFEMTEISKDDIDERSFKGINSYFRDKVVGRSRKIDKIKVAKKMHDLIADGISPQKQTIATFSKLFETMNKALSMS